MTFSSKLEKKWIKSALLGAIGWLFIGGAISTLIAPSEKSVHLIVFIEFWILSTGDLYFLGKLVADLIRLVSDEGEMKAESIVSAVTWGALKFLTLGVMIWRMIVTKEPFGLALALGVATVFVVPMSSSLIGKLKKDLA